ncbi:hypothetical protein [Parvibaculum sp.]|uniref:hypothetical protein n=1 Tax=Parvibaculum sp. TaxID=2024848 RepID=UPI00320CE523
MDDALASPPAPTDRARRLTVEALATRVLPIAVCLYAVIRAIRAFGEYNHNDHMYVAAASLFPHLALYRDIAYVQTPLSIFLYAALNALFGPSWLYLSARLTSVLFVLGAALLAAKTAERLAQRTYVFWISFALILFNHGTFSNMAQTGNYALPLLLFAFACFRYFGRTVEKFDALLIGLCLGLASSSKVSFIAPMSAFALIFVVDRQSRMFALQYVLGCVLGLLPILYYLIADWPDFLFLNFEFHLLTNDFRGLTIHTSIIQVVRGFAYFLKGVTPVWLILAMAAPILATWTSHQSLRNRVAAAAAVIFASTVASAIMPMTYQLPYWGPAALAFTMFAVPAAAVVADRSPVFRTAAMLIALGLAGLSSAADIWLLTRDGADKYPPVLVMRAQAAIARSVGAALRDHPGCVTEILSASAIPALGSGVPLSPGSAGGEFLFRIDGLLRHRHPEFRKYSDVTRYMGPTTGLLVGYYGERGFDGQMLGYALTHDFGRAGTFNYPKSPLSLYLPPECQTPAPSPLAFDPAFPILRGF